MVAAGAAGVTDWVSVFLEDLVVLEAFEDLAEDLGLQFLAEQLRENREEEEKKYNA